MKLDALKMAKDSGLPSFTEYGNECLVRLVNAVLEAAAQKCMQGDNEYKNGIECAAAIREMKS